MGYLEEMDAIISERNQKHQEISLRIKRNQERVERLKKFAENSPEYLRQLNEEFEAETELSSLEIKIMFVVIGLQLLRQHFLTNFEERVDDQQGADDTWGHGEEHSDRHHRYYNPSLDEIITNPVPFDANIGADGALSGGGKLGHRATALGHDPLIGLIVGTANIATSTLTTCRLESYHIKTNNKRDVFAENADTSLVMQKTIHKLFNEGIDGTAKVGAAFIKEIIHLRSDLYTTNSLPLPGISLINPALASEFAEYGLDFANVLTVFRQVMYARLINSFAAMYHYSFYDGSIRKGLYKVKTKKIICYANVVASGVNIAEVCITKDLNKLDIGGIANTIFEVVTSVQFIKKVKRDYIFGEYDKALSLL